jgi:hypothetical protein
MKTARLFATMTFITILVSGLALAGTVVWDFEDPGQLADLAVVNGTWEINGGVLQEVSGAESAMHAFLGDASWGDYTLEAKVRVDEGKYTGLLVRGKSDMEYYAFYLELTPEPGNLCFFKHVADGGRTRPEPNKSPAGHVPGLAPGEWYTLKIIAVGNSFQAFINDVEVMAAGTDNLGDEYPTGKVGLFCWQTKTSFDDVTVTGDSIAAVDAQDKLAVTWGGLKE